MWWILDILIVLIVAFYIYSCARRGFVRTVIEMIGYFLAIYLAFSFSGVIAESVYDNFVGPSIAENISDKLSLSPEADTDDKVDAIWDSLPEIVLNDAANSKNQLKNSIINNNSNVGTIESLAQKATDATVKPTVLPIIQTVATILLFFILMFVVKFIARIINKVFNLPLIGSLNKFLGGIIGGFKGAIFATIFVMIIMFVISLTKEGFWIFTEENIDKSVLFKFLAGFSPFK